MKKSLLFIFTLLFAATNLFATTWYVATTGVDAPGNGTLVNPYQTITFAINQGTTVNSDIIVVAAGTYTEAITINKSLILQGAQANIDARTRGVVPETVLNYPGGLAISAGNVIIDGFTITGQTLVNAGPGFGFAVNMASGATGSQLLNNIIRNNISGSNIRNTGASQVIIRYNWFDSNNNPGAAGGSGIYTDNYAGGGIISNVLIDKNKFTGHIDDGGIDFSVDNAAQAATGIIISNNEFNGNRRAAFLYNVVSSSFTANNILNSTGVGTGDLRIYGGVNNLTVTNNFFTAGVPNGVRITNDGVLDNSSITFNQNSVLGYSNTNPAINIVSGYPGVPLNATCNWWGSACSQDFSGYFSGPVDLSTWLVGSTDGGDPGFVPADDCKNTDVSTSVINGLNVVCGNSTGVTYSVTATPGSTYAWTITGGTQMSGTNTNGITVDWGATGPGNVKVVETNSTSCVGSPVNRAVTINPLPAAATGLANQTRIGNGDVTFTVNDPGNGYTVEWSTDGSTNNDGTAVGAVGPFTKTKTLAYPGSPPPGDPVTVVVYARISNDATGCKSAWSYDYHGTAYNPTAPPVFGSTRNGQSNGGSGNDYVNRNGKLGDIPQLSNNGQDFSLVSTDGLALTVTLVWATTTTAFSRIPVSSTPVIARGICWGPTATPNIYGSHTVDGSGVQDLTTAITATSGNYARAWAINSSGLHYSAAILIP